jgi:hypothetical protein
MISFHIANKRVEHKLLIPRWKTRNVPLRVWYCKVIVIDFSILVCPAPPSSGTATPSSPPAPVPSSPELAAPTGWRRLQPTRATSFSPTTLGAPPPLYGRGTASHRRTGAIFPELRSIPSRGLPPRPAAPPVSPPFSPLSCLWRRDAASRTARCPVAVSWPRRPNAAACGPVSRGPSRPFGRFNRRACGPAARGGGHVPVAISTGRAAHFRARRRSVSAGFFSNVINSARCWGLWVKYKHKW